MKRIFAILLAAAIANAQCVMCFRTAAAQQAERARMLNLGILIMLVPPFLILGGFLYLIYRRRATFAEGALEAGGTGRASDSPAALRPETTKSGMII